MVVGSGPSGFAVVKTLVEAGQSVLVIDLGGKPDYELVQRAKAYSLGQEESVFAELHNFSSKTKTFWGSDFAYGNHAGLVSRAHGGFSWVWGATWLPYSEAELEHFPQSYVFEYREAWKHVSAWVQSRLAVDDLSHQFMPPTNFWEEIAIDCKKTDESVLPRGRRSFGEIGLARLALSAPSPDNDPTSGCIRCGKCQLGCPFGHIWNSSMQFQSLNSESGVEYLTAKVVAFRTETEELTIEYKEQDDRTTRRLRCKRLFLCAGPVATAEIVLNSSKNSIEELRLADSQTSLIGGIRFSPTRFQNEGLSLPLLQSHFAFRKGDLAGHSQLYEVGEVLWGRICAQFHWLRKLPKSIASVAQTKLFAGLMYQPESHSGHLLLKLDSSGSMCVSRKRKPCRRARSVISLILHGIIMRRVRFFPLLVSDLDVGNGNHLGNLRTEKWVGRGPARPLFDFLAEKNVWMCDSSSLRKLPVGPITASVMTNARLITNQALRSQRL